MLEDLGVLLRAPQAYACSAKPSLERCARGSRMPSDYAMISFMGREKLYGRPPRKSAKRQGLCTRGLGNISGTWPIAERRDDRFRLAQRIEDVYQE